jgi:hypothetical protein
MASDETKELKIRGNIEGPTFANKKVGDSVQQVCTIKIEFRTSANRHLDFNDLVSLASEGSGAINLSWLTSQQRSLFDRINEETRMAKLEIDERLKKCPKAQDLLKEIKAKDKKEKLSGTRLRFELNGVEKILNRHSMDQHVRIENIEYDKAYNKCAEAQKAILKIQKDDRKQKLSDDQLRPRLDKVDDILEKFKSEQKAAEKDASSKKSDGKQKTSTQQSFTNPPSPGGLAN